MDRVKFADKTSSVLNRRGRAALTLTALVLLLGVVIAGEFLAGRVSGFRDHLQQSSLLQSLTEASDQARVSQIIASPRNAALLVKYIDSLAGVVSNLEVSPQWRFGQFTALIDAADASGVSISGFFCGADGGELTVTCSGEGKDQFLELLGESQYFTEVELADMDEQDSKEFTINCYFKS